MRSTAKKPTNLSLDPVLLQNARALGVNVSQAAEIGLRQAVAAAQSAQWQDDNADALQSANDWVDRSGLPLGRFRTF